MSHKTLLERLTKEQIVELLEECRGAMREMRGLLRVDQYDGHRRFTRKLEPLLSRLDQALSEFNRPDSTTERGGGGVK